MALPLVLMAAGTVLQLAGNYQANQAQAKSEQQNQLFYGKQADLALEATFREKILAQRTYARTRGFQYSTYAKGGVDIAGSAAISLASTYAKEVEELNAIKIKGSIDYDLARLRGIQSGDKARLLNSTDYNALQAGSTILTNYTAYANAGGSISGGAQSGYKSTLGA